MFDWNGNGKEDWEDEFLDYMIFQEVTKDINNKNDDHIPTPIVLKPKKTKTSVSRKRKVRNPKDMTGTETLVCWISEILSFVFINQIDKHTNDLLGPFYLLLSMIAMMIAKRCIFGKKPYTKENGRKTYGDSAIDFMSKMFWGFFILMAVTCVIMFVDVIDNYQKKDNDDYRRTITHSVSRTAASDWRTTASTTSPSTTKQYAATTRKSTATKKSTTKYDEFNVYDYDDPEDFYEDNYDDFWEYEDAEDYYNEKFGY